MTREQEIERIVRRIAEGYQPIKLILQEIVARGKVVYAA